MEKKIIKAKLYSFKNLEEKTKILPKDFFGVEENNTLLAESVKVYLANQRKARAKVKTRSEVSGSGKKIWRQKGTGRARHGDRYTPIFVSGGVAHGPTGRENWHLFFPKKKRIKALKVALGEKFRRDELILIDDFSQVKKTKEAEELLLKLLKKVSSLPEKSYQPITTLVISKDKPQSFLPFRNLSWVKVVRPENLNPYFILNNKFLIFEERALEQLIKND